MMRWIVAAGLVFTLVCVIDGVTDLATAAPLPASVDRAEISQAVDVSARRRDHHDGHAIARPYVVYHYGHPYYYSPGPFFPYLPLIPAWPDNPLGW